MRKTLLCFAALASVAAAAAADNSYASQAWFRDGVGLEIHTETTGSTYPISTGGSIGVGYDQVDRFVLDMNNNVLFAYNLEATRAATPGAVAIRVKPIDPRIEANILGKDWSGRFHVSGSHVPTVAAIREFPSVKIGEAVTLDVLYNPSTGEKVYDVLRPITEASPYPNSPMLTTQKLMSDQLSFKEATLRVSGQAMQIPGSWLTGQAARLYIPGRGAFIVSVSEPKQASSGPVFHEIANADRNRLSWVMDGDLIEITSKTNVLTRSERGVFWVSHDPHYKPQEQPEKAALQTADSAEYLLRNR